MGTVEHLNEDHGKHAVRADPTNPSVLALLERNETARAVERQAERAERARLIEAMSKVAAARDGEKADWQAKLDDLAAELKAARDALAQTRLELDEALEQSKQTREARERDRAMYQTDRSTWAQERRQLKAQAEGLKKEADRGWLSRLVRGKGAV
jgi:septal ring factor EnvC (AmiA/AmiB activator)